MANATKTMDSPVGTLEWAYIDGEGKPDLQGVPKYQISLVLDPAVAEPFKAMVEEFWNENKPKSAKIAKSLGFYPHKVKDVEASSEAGETVYKDTGNTVVVFKTNTKYQNGDPKVIKIFNSKGNEVSLQGKKIGNGSRGRVSGVMGVYDFNKASQGVTFYLNGVQLSKFVEYTGGVNFDSLEDPDGGDFEGVAGQPGAIADESADGSIPFERPRL